LVDFLVSASYAGVGIIHKALTRISSLFLVLPQV
jgi:hypothetical protein